MTPAFTATYETDVPLIELLEQWRRLCRKEDIGVLTPAEHEQLDYVRQMLGKLTVRLESVINTEFATAVDDRKAAEQDALRRKLEDARVERPRLPAW